MKLKTLDNLDLKGKKVLLRCDLNITFDLQGKVLDSTKIKRHKITIDELIYKGAKIVVISHLGRPKGNFQENLSLKKVLETFANIIKISKVTVMPFCKPDVLKKVINDVDQGTITFMENIRFHHEEEQNDEVFAKELAECADCFVNDAFSVAHRKHVSTYGLAKFLPTYAGRYLELEFKMLNKIFDNLNKPLKAIVGGSKISTKILLLNNLLKKVDKLVIGGAMAGTAIEEMRNKSDGVEYTININCENVSSTCSNASDTIVIVQAISDESDIISDGSNINIVRSNDGYVRVVSAQ